MSNLFTELVALLPSTSLEVGTIESVSDGVCTLLLPGGGHVQVRGSGSVGQRVFFRGGLIESNAPTLDYVEAIV